MLQLSPKDVQVGAGEYQVVELPVQADDGLKIVVSVADALIDGAHRLDRLGRHGGQAG